MSLFNAVRNSKNGCHLFHYANLNEKPQARTDLKQFTFASSYWDRTERCSRKKIRPTLLELYLHQAITKKGMGDFTSACNS